MKRKSKGGHRGAQRVDRMVRELYPSLTGRQIVEALDHGLITSAEGKRLAKGDKIESAEGLISVELEKHLRRLAVGNPALEVAVVHRGSDFLVIDKPAGMPSHPLGLFDENTVTHWALARFPELRGEFPEIQPTVTPHRLDTWTSGLLVVALTRGAFMNWRQRFSRNRVKKRYLAWCWGRPERAVEHTDAPIAHHPRDRRRMVVVSGSTPYLPPVLPASTHMQVVERQEALGCFLADVSCQSGVTHQVRVHLAALGFPLVGDRLYDPDFEIRPLGRSHHLLRASRLTFDSWTCEAEVQGFVEGLER